MMVLLLLLLLLLLLVLLLLLLLGVDSQVLLLRPGRWDWRGGVGGRPLLVVKMELEMLDGHHAVGVHHHVPAQAVLEVGGVEGGSIL